MSRTRPWSSIFHKNGAHFGLVLEGTAMRQPAGPVIAPLTLLMLKASRYRYLSASTARKAPTLEVTGVPGGSGAAVVWVISVVTTS